MEGSVVHGARAAGIEGSVIHRVRTARTEGSVVQGARAAGTEGTAELCLCILVVEERTESHHSQVMILHGCEA